jgi:hypothetical protein
VTVSNAASPRECRPYSRPARGPRPAARITRGPLGYLLAVPAFFAVAGCGTPSGANIELRKQNQDLRSQVERLTLARAADAATIKSLEERVGTVPTLPADRLERLYTVHGLQLNRLTGGADLDREKPGDEGVQVYAVPTDQDGHPLKAAGAFTVEIFDLAAQPTRIGQWTFDLPRAKEAWNGAAMSYQYVLKSPWQTPPGHDDLTLKVTFHDELTGRDFTAQKQVKVTLPPPAATPAK